MATPRNIREAREPRRHKGIVLSEFTERVNLVKVIYSSSSRSAAYEVDVWYYPGKFDDEMTRRLDSRNRSDEEDAADVLNDFIITVVKEWDIVDNDGQKIPPGDIVTDLEMSFKTAVVRAIQNDLQPGESRRQRSADLSRQADETS